jgi:hypothetical protein
VKDRQPFIDSSKSLSHSWLRSGDRVTSTPQQKPDDFASLEEGDERRRSFDPLSSGSYRYA